ncbi:Era-like GTP-binding protein [Synechococcus sp. Nb3U1]|uniref:Era-like GTP-binding protein n=1 Tax=Synechococcus sp. Nb3U1 TaxID=1914529 RepID=UPI001F2DDE5A|nr:Era-like GTP-binding protein [Synechococcus sp. Nb3U1]MCF2971697.1 Era-like GTP-binding protein [Synechococcus sp. Nb3U1]
MITPLAQAETVLNHCWEHWQAVANRADLKPELRSLSELRKRLGSRLFSIAVFGLVNRGKSAVLNALTGETRLKVGPLNGVTQQPQSMLWRPESGIPWRVRLIDTPGLNEVEGEAREQLAWDVARSADLILFVIAADLTQLEYQALLELRTLHKPILLVLNKCDLYSAEDLEAIRAQISRPQLGLGLEILTVAACPKPVKVRTHWPDGRITTDWERPAPQMDALRGRILQILQTEAGSLLALNVLKRLDRLQAQILRKQWQHHAGFVDRWSKACSLAKGLGIGLAPLGLDLLLAPLLDGLWLLGLCLRLRLPWGTLRGALGSRQEGLWRPLVVNSALLLLAEGLGSWLWGGWGSGLFPGLVAGVSLYRLGDLAPQVLTQFATGGFGLAASLNALIGGDKLATKQSATALPVGSPL